MVVSWAVEGEAARGPTPGGRCPAAGARRASARRWVVGRRREPPAEVEDEGAGRRTRAGQLEKMNRIAFCDTIRENRAR